MVCSCRGRHASETVARNVAPVQPAKCRTVVETGSPDRQKDARSVHSQADEDRPNANPIEHAPALPAEPPANGIRLVVAGSGYDPRREVIGRSAGNWSSRPSRWCLVARLNAILKAGQWFESTPRSPLAPSSPVYLRSSPTTAERGVRLTGFAPERTVRTADTAMGRSDRR